MKCYSCNSNLIWGGDHENDDGEHNLVTNLSCQNCNAFIIVYWDNEKNNNNSEKDKR
tara:strand:+ start:409 stop:579 length:171 start_codon:yes stop_codon:yes gene_type:complete